MSEFLSPEGSDLNTAQLQQLEVVGAAALGLMEANYGSGYPHYRGGVNGGLAFHNLHHASKVELGTDAVAAELGLPRDDRATGRVAARAHDVVQLKARGVMERESAEWLEERLRSAVPPRLRRMGALAILGTEPLFAPDGTLIGQMVSQLEYPDLATERVAQSVACADFGELYMPEGPLLGHEFYKEICGVAPDGEPNMDGLLGFQRGQLQLVTDYRYPHPVGERLFGALRGPVIDYTAKVLQDLEAGTLENWEELMARDTAFLREHAG